LEISIVLIWGCQETGPPVLLVMSDHIMELGMIRKIVKHAINNDKAFLLCLDRRPSFKTAEEGLKLSIEEGRVVLSGKDLSPTFGIDTGIIYCGSASLEYFREAITRYGKEASISDALNIAAARNDIGFVDVTGLLWKDIDTQEDLEDARALYYEILRRDLVKPSDGLVSRLFNRRISTRISLFLYKRSLYLHPNIISLTSFLVAILGAWSMVSIHPIAGAFLVQFASILDGVDGEVGRLFKSTSSLGEVVDNVLDRLADIAVITGVAAISWPMGLTDLLVTVIASAGAALVSQSTRLFSALPIDIERLRMIPATRDARLFSVFASTIAGYPIASIYYMAISSLLFVLVGLSSLLRLPYRHPLAKTSGRREAWPKITRELEARYSARSVTTNTFRLVLGLLVTRLVLPPLSDVTLLQQPVMINVENILPLAEMALILYLGSKIIRSSGVLIEYASYKLVHRFRLTSTIIRETINDTIYLLFAFTLWAYSWGLSDLPQIGQSIVKLVAPMTAIIVIYMVYRVVSRLLRVYKEVIERI